MGNGIRILFLGHQFAETMDVSAAIESGIMPPAGLTNLMNTCYANSVLQVLHKIPELDERLKSVPDNLEGEHGTPAALTCELRKTFESMGNSVSAVKPITLINVEIGCEIDS